MAGWHLRPPSHPYHACRYSGRTVSKLLATLIAGALIGATGQVLQLFIDAGVRTHNQLLQQALAIGLGQALGSELIISTSLVLAAAAMVLLFAPLAAGGGVAVCPFLGTCCSSVMAAHWPCAAMLDR
jgi:hypothetical protein